MLSKQAILDKTNNGFEVFRYYIDTKWQLGKNFRNPLYDDKKASCNVYFDRRYRIYKLKDFGNDAYSGDCFDIVGKLKNLNCSNPKDFVEILETINRDLSLGLSSDDTFVLSVSPVVKTAKKPELPVEPKKVKPYSIVQQYFSAKETAFWQQYGITPETLKTYKVCSLKEFRSENNEGKPFAFSSSAAEPVFGYVGKRHVKIYRPFSDVRFLYGGNL
ncbi:MAG: bifunctional DNA primase/helicase, partial [Dysgonamonadaceae bacterium]|nr:bifunctional DNA primase/helicase [Dysgonamonadaceae bacterium]